MSDPRTIRFGMVRHDAKKDEIFVLDAGDHYIAASWDGAEMWPLGQQRPTESLAYDDACDAIAQR